MDLSDNYDKKCEQVWLSAWLATAGTDSCKRKEIATTWADDCLKEFKLKFPRPRPQTVTKKSGKTIPSATD